MVSGAIFLVSAAVWLIAIVLGIVVLVLLWPLYARLAKWLLVGGLCIGIGWYAGGNLLGELGLTWGEAGELLANGVGWLVAISIGTLVLWGLWAIAKGSRAAWRERKLDYVEQEAKRRKDLGYDD